ncbi:MAG: glutamine amidotransferase [Clostridia bacterium]|nr:glutamine amidotransferase [Clostridia bacterium]
MEKVACLYVFDTMADWEYAILVSELHSGGYFRPGRPPIRVITAARTSDPVTTMGGIRILPDLTVADCRTAELAALILPGGETWASAEHDPVLALAALCLREGIPVGAICGAVLGLARTGQLNDRLHTANDLGWLRASAPEYRGETHYRHAPAVADGPLVTATGAAPLEFAMEMLRILDVFTREILDAWYRFYKTQAPEAYYTLAASLSQV